MYGVLSECIVVLRRWKALSARLRVDHLCYVPEQIHDSFCQHFVHLYRIPRLIQSTSQRIKTCNKGWPVNCHKKFYIEQFQLRGSSIDEQGVGETNPCILSGVFRWFEIWTIAASFGAFTVVWPGISFFWDTTFMWLGNMILMLGGNVRIWLPSDTTSYPRRRESSNMSLTL